MIIVVANVPELDEPQMIAVTRTLGNVCYQMGLGVVTVSVESDRQGGLAP